MTELTASDDAWSEFSGFSRCPTQHGELIVPLPQVESGASRDAKDQEARLERPAAVVGYALALIRRDAKARHLRFKLAVTSCVGLVAQPFRAGVERGHVYARRRLDRGA